MKKLGLWNIVLGLCLLLIVAALCGPGEKAYGADKVLALSKNYNWKMTSFFPTNHAENRALVEFVNKLKERTDGKVKIALYESVLGAPTDHWDMVKGNATQLAFIAEAYSQGRMPVATLTNLPFEVPDLTMSKHVFDEWMKAGYLRELTDNFKVIFYKPTLPQQLFLSKKKIVKLEDFKGLKIRSAAGLQGKAITALGAAGVSMPGGEMYMALQTGVIDGTITGIDNIVDRKLYEVCKVGLQLPIYGGIWVTVMNKETWNSLPKELQTLVDEVGHEVAASDLKRMIDDEKAKWEVAKNKGMTVYTVPRDEAARWRKVTSDVDDTYVKEWNAKGYPVKAALEMMRKITTEK